MHRSARRTGDRRTDQRGRVLRNGRDDAKRIRRSGSRRQKTTELRSPRNKLRELTPIPFLLDSRRVQVLKVYEALRGR